MIVQDAIVLFTTLLTVREPTYEISQTGNNRRTSLSSRTGLYGNDRLLAKGEDIIPIPGTKRQARLHENIGALEIELTADERQQIEAVVPIGAAGTRYPEAVMHSVNR